MADPHDLRYLAFYLPQFHPTQENDEWWGPGFTDWVNVARGTPLFRSHHQPHVPADLGFYDLRVAETRDAQAALATTYGIDAFCYYHYWFEGRRLLHRPIDEVLRLQSPDLPFCLCWANENWTRAWDGKARDVILEQRYSPDDDLRHIRWLAEAFGDDRYATVGGRPLFLVYRATHLPDARRTTDCWRAEAERLGIGALYLCAVQTGPDVRVDPTSLGFDAAVQFAPFDALGPRRGLGLARRAARRWLRVETLGSRHRLHDYDDVARRHLDRDAVSYPLFPGVTPGFDNSPRRPESSATIVRGATPAAYEQWLRAAVAGFTPPSPDENLVFVNAWNEWAEGNHLEPCLRWGRGYLEAHARAVGVRG